MNLQVQKILEFDKIKSKLSDMAVCSYTKEYISGIKPTSDIGICSGWLDETESAVEYTLKRGRIPVRPVRSVDDLLRISKIGGIIYNRELLQIKDLLHISRGIKEHLASHGRNDDREGYGIAENLILELYTDRRLEDRIERIILSEDEIADDASPALMSIRRKIIKEQEAIKNKLDTLIRTPANSRYLQDPIVTVRKGRYVIPVKAEFKGEIKGLIHDSSSSGQTFFIEPLSVLEANNRIKELMRDEEIEIERILRELTHEISLAADDIKRSTAVLFKLDFHFAKAAYALETDSTRPQMNRNGRIRIVKGRHPLIAKGDVVPIDYEMGVGYRSVVVTGPNTGGKTVTLKTIGLFTLMAQAGIFIPASSGSEISIFKEVFADIGDEQSIEQSLSTFSSHMRNIVHILQRAKSSHLVLLDELGAGTDPVEGAALAISILEHLRKRNISCIATTHYSELKIYALNTSGVINASCEFDIETLRPTYRLLIGIPGRSNAFEISKRLGLDGDIVEQAGRYISDKDTDLENTISKLQEYRAQTERDMELAQRDRAEAEALKDKNEAVRKEFDEKRQQVITDARREAYEIVQKAKTEVRAILNECRAVYDMKDKVEISKKLNSLLAENEGSTAVTGADSPSGDGEITGTIEKGSRFYVPRLNSIVQAVSEVDESGELTVVKGNFRIRLNRSELRPPGKDNKTMENHPGGYSFSRPSFVAAELDIRGESIDDAIAKLDKYLDDAHLAGLGQVTVIHGKGTGALREGVAEFLKGRCYVGSFRTGGIGEGDTGVTIVTLK